MPRPKTIAATYQLVTFRIPPKVLAQVKRRIRRSGVPMNTELIHLVELGLKAQATPLPAEASRLEEV